MTQDMPAAASIAALAQYCYAIVPEKPPGQRIVVIKAGEDGHYVTDIDHASLPLDHVQTIVTRLNVCLGVTPDQQNAMLAGSMFGWHVAGAGRRHGLH